MQLQEPKNRGMAATLPVVDGRHLGATPFASNSRYALTEASALSPGMCARRRLQGNCHFALNCAAGAREELLCVACGYEERRPIRWSNRRGLHEACATRTRPLGHRGGARCRTKGTKHLIAAALAGRTEKSRRERRQDEACPASLDTTDRQAASASSCHSLLGSSINLPPIDSNSVARS